jgi:putrescine aminotransferase
MQQPPVIARFPAPALPRAPEDLPETFAWFRRMREDEPVAAGERHGTRFWQVFRYEDVLAITTDHDRFSSQVLASGDENLTVRVLSKDPPNHRNLRRLVNAAFTRRAIGQMSGRIADLTQELLDGIRPRGRMDVVAEVAAPLPARVIAEMLGVPAEDWNVFQRWAGVAGRETGASAAASKEVRQEMREYFAGLLEERRGSPREDLVTALAEAEVDGDRLSDRDVISLCSLVLIAGQETTKNLIANFFLLMSQHPDALARLTGDPGLMPAAIEEVLRFMPSVWFLLRRARTDVELSGVQIREGELVLPWVASANRDPARFPEPERFDIARDPNHHLSFGHGIHFCVGAPLARLQASVALPMLLEQLGHLRFQRTEPIRIRPGVIFIVDNVPVQFDGDRTPDEQPSAAAGGVRAVLDRHRRHVNRTAAGFLDLLGAPMEVSSSGSQVRDDQGISHLDCGGYGVFLLGHCHPRVVEAVAAQVRRHPLATHALVEPHLSAAAAALSGVAPAGLDYVSFTNSGAEATELGLKLARANGRRRVIAMEGSYHGMTLGALSVTACDHYREPFQPLVPDVQFVPYGELEALEQALAGPGGPAAVIVEPVQGEAGVRIPPTGYLRGVRALCDQHDGLLIADEIQTGMGRLGMWWGCAAEDVVPDVMLAGKTLGGGVMPVGAVLARTAVFEPLNKQPLLHATTFGGNPLAAVAAATTVAVLKEERLVERARELGERLLPELREIVRRRCPDLILEVRGRGLLIGVEPAEPRLAGLLVTSLLRRRVLVALARAPRLFPPAVLTDLEVDWLLTAFDEAAAELPERARGNTWT